MPASIFTSKKSALLLASLLLLAHAAHADGDKKDRSLPPDDDDFKNTPFTEYGSFNEDADEDQETRFMQYGRLFGVSLGAGNEGVMGNRGALWRGGFPMLELKMHYWFDFQLAIALVFATSSHDHDPPTTSIQNSVVNVSTTRIGVDLKYYFDVKNASAPISFANPYVFGGVGSYSKTETDLSDSTLNNSDSAMYFGGGAGLEFAIKPRKSYFEMEGRVFNATFKDSNSPYTTAGTSLTNLGGLFYSFSGTVLFTW